MKKFILPILILCAVQVVCAQDGVMSQASTAQGFAVHLQPGLLSLQSDDQFITSAESGFMIGGRASYGFSELIEAYVQAHFAPTISTSIQFYDDYSISQFGFGARFNFSSTLKPLRPFADVGYSFVRMKLPELLTDGNGQSLGLVDSVYDGGGITFGGGLKYYLSIPLALQAGALFTSGSFTSWDRLGFVGDINYDLFTGRYYISVAYYIK